jgi:O-acetyl-ADP-ribose deacetylase (regulator of RNase III)
MTFQIIQGDLFDPSHEFDALAQGVNAQGVMGAGIAVPFRKTWPDMYEAYKEICARFGDALGGLVHIWNPPFEQVEAGWSDDGLPYFSYVEAGPVIYNMFSQVLPGRNGDYRLLQQAAISVVLDAEEQGIETVGLPWIGCGIAGLERHNVATILEKAWENSDVEFILVQTDAIHEPPTEEELAKLPQ